MTQQTKMPDPVACLWLKDGVAVNAFDHPPGDRQAWDRDGYWAEKGYDRAPLITTDQAEAYKDACVREALEMAAQEIELCHSKNGSQDDFQRRAAEAIRALIQPSKENENG